MVVPGERERRRAGHGQVTTRHASDYRREPVPTRLKHPNLPEKHSTAPARGQAVGASRDQLKHGRVIAMATPREHDVLPRAMAE